MLPSIRRVAKLSSGSGYAGHTASASRSGTLYAVSRVTHIVDLAARAFVICMCMNMVGVEGVEPSSVDYKSTALTVVLHSHFILLQLPFHYVSILCRRAILESHQSRRLCRPLHKLLCQSLVLVAGTGVEPAHHSL